MPKSIEDRVLADPARENSASRPKLDIDDFRKNPGLIKEIVSASLLYVDTAVNTDLATAIKNSGISEADRSRLDPMVTGLHLGDPRVADRLLHELYKTKGTFTASARSRCTRNWSKTCSRAARCRPARRRRAWNR